MADDAEATYDIPPQRIGARFASIINGIRLPLALVPGGTADAYNSQAAWLYYSKHEGIEALRPWAKLHLGDPDAADALGENGEVPWGLPSVRLEDAEENAKLGPKEFAWNDKKLAAELEAALASGVVIATGKRANQAFYRDLPIVRLACTVDPLTKECNKRTQAEDEARKKREAEAAAAGTGAVPAPPPHTCAFPACEVSVDLQVCTRCKGTRYCCQAHQAAHWKRHKQVCKSG